MVSILKFYLLLYIIQLFEYFKKIKIYLDSISFQINGLFSDTMKLKRHEAKKLYKKQIDEIYKLDVK